MEKDNLEDGGAENITFYLDGAHTKESMLCCAKWYQSATRLALEAAQTPPRNGERWLMFNCMKERDPNVLFEPLLTVGHNGSGSSHASHGFSRSLFVPFVSSTNSLGQTNRSDFKWENSLKVSVSLARKMHYSGYSGRQLVEADFDRFTHIFAMDHQNLKNIDRREIV